MKKMYNITDKEYKQLLNDIKFYVGDEDLAADIVNYAIINYEGKNNCSFKSYLYMVSKYREIQHWRKKAVRPIIINEDADYISINNNKKEDNDKIMLVREALEYLKEKNKNTLKFDVFFAYYFFDMKQHEVAKSFGIQRSHVKSLLSRAKKEVQLYIKKKQNNENKI